MYLTISLLPGTIGDSECAACGGRFSRSGVYECLCTECEECRAVLPPSKLTRGVCGPCIDKADPEVCKETVGCECAACRAEMAWDAPAPAMSSPPWGGR